MNKYIVIDKATEHHAAMWYDLKGTSVTYLKELFQCKNRVVRAIIKIFYKDSFYHKKLEFLKKWLYSYYSLEGVRMSTDDEYYIIFTDSSLSKYDYHYLKNKKERNHCRYVLIFLNIYANVSKSTLEKIDLMDRIFTMEKQDESEHGFEYVGQVYSKVPMEAKGEVPECDLFFIGLNKGRETMLHALFRHLHGNVVCDFTIIGVKKKRQLYPAFITYNRRMGYEEILEHVNSANCILDMVQKGQTGLTFRPLEAICYNKKLLTNNPAVKGLSYYDERFMRVFDTMEEIDISFITEKMEVDYHYSMDFSPLRILEKLGFTEVMY